MRKVVGLKILALFGMALFLGCGGAISPEDALKEANKTNVLRLANCYSMYQYNNGWQGPEDEASFKKYLQSVESSVLERMGIEPADIDSIFVSERDGQPFKVRYAVEGAARGTSEAVVFETVGSGGKFMVGFLNSTQKEVDQAEYDQLLSADDEE